MNMPRMYTARMLVAMAFCAGAAWAQETPPASPEPADTPVVEQVVSPSAEQEPTTEVIIETTPETPSSTPSTDVLSPTPSARRIEQRVDGAALEQPIRVAPRPKKNVTRVDNRPNKPRVRAVAVIKGPVAPWGYAGRYASGEVVRPSAKELQGTNTGPGQQRQGNLSGLSASGGSSRRGGARKED